MKKLTKILLGSILSVAMVVSGALAFNKYTPNVTKAANATVNTADMGKYVETENGYAYVGKLASASGTFTAAASSTYNHAGLILTGGDYSTFNLGTIDISKSHWITSDDTQGHRTAPTSKANLSPFITWNHAIGNANAKHELGGLHFYLYDHNDHSNYIKITWADRSAEQGEGSFGVRAMASNQSIDGCYRQSKGFVAWKDGYVTKNRSELGTLLGVGKSGSVTGIGSNIPFAMVFDTDKNCLYTTSTSNAVDTLKQCYAIRDFDEEAYEVDSGVTGAVSGDVKWNGFSSNLVDIKVEFTGVTNNNQTSIVVRSLGGKNLGQETITVEDSEYVKQLSEYNVGKSGKTNAVIYAPIKTCAFDESFIENSYLEILNGEEKVDGITFTSATAKYDFASAGTYTLNFYDVEGGNLIGSQTHVVSDGEEFSNENLGEITSTGTVDYGTHALKRYTGTVVKGLRLEGGLGSTFNLGTVDISSGKWNGTETSLGTVAPTNTFEFFFDAVEMLKPDAYEAIKIDVTLTDVEDPTKFITVRYVAQWENSAVATNTSLVYIQAKANNQSFGAWRADKTTVKNQTPQSSIMKAEDAKVLGYGNSNIKTTILGSTAPFSFCYDYEKNALYRSVVGNANTYLSSAYIVRNFESETYPALSGKPAIETATDNTWDGFTSSKVNVSVKFAESKNANSKFAMVVTKMGNIDLSAGADLDIALPEMPKLVKVGKSTTFSAPKFEHNLYTNFINGSKYVITKDGETVDTLTFDSETVDYVFNEEGEYEIVIYNDNDEIISETYTVTATESTFANFSVQNADLYLNDAVLTEFENVELKVGDVINLIPSKESCSQIDLTDIRYLSYNNVEYPFNETTKKNENTIFTKVDGEDGVYYTHTIDSNDTQEASIDLKVTFDRYCKITVIDTEKAEGEQESVTYRWAVDGEFKFPNTVAQNGTTIRRGSSTDKVLIAYARKDLAYKEGNEFIPYDRTDGFVGGNDNLKTLLNATTNKTLTYYNRDLGSKHYKRNNPDIDTKKFNIDEKNDPMIAIIPDIVFETIYLEIKIDYEIILSNGNNASSLNFVVKFNKEDMDNYFQYIAHENANTTGNPFGNIYNYVTTQGELTKGELITDKNIALDKIGSSHWNGTGWDNAEIANGLGLYNGTGKTAEEMVDKPGYIVKKFAVGENIWGNSTPSDEYYSYGVDISVFDEAYLNTEFVFMPVVNIREFYGSATCFVINAVKVTPKAEAVTKLTNVLLTEKPNETYYTLNDGTNTYYSLYTVEDVQWLATMAGDAREFTEGAIAI